MANGWGGARPGSGPKKKPTASDGAAKEAVVENPPKLAAAPRISQPMFSTEAVEHILSAMKEIGTRSRNRPRTMDWCPFKIETKEFSFFPDRAMPKKKNLRMAYDSALQQNNQYASQAWMAGGLIGNAVSEGLLFLGYPYLSELAQRPEFRLFGEIRAEEMVRKWTEFRGTRDESTKEKDKIQPSNRDDEDRAKQRRRDSERPRSDRRNVEIEQKIKELKDFEEELKVKNWFKTAASQDSYFGISHLLLETRSVNLENLQDPELKTDIGTGRNRITLEKIGKSGRGFLKSLRIIEPIWCYPTTYNAVNPLLSSWYEPQVWYVMGTEIHKSRLLTFIGRPVPDILKPAYAFGGISQTQLAQPYVDIWLRTRESVGEMLHAFSVMVLKTNMATTTMPGGAGGGTGDVLARLMLFLMLRDNQGVFAIDKNTEDFTNVSAPLGGLDELQAQAQEHLFSVGRIPAVKYAGIQPKGLNATSEGELRAFYDTIHSAQEHLFSDHLRSVYDFMQISLWGERDPDITFDFVPLWEMTEKEKAEVRKMDAETAQIRVDSGVISQEEERRRVANDPESGYDGLDPEDVPDLLEEEEQGLEPQGGRPQPQAEVGEKEQGVGDSEVMAMGKNVEDLPDSLWRGTDDDAPPVSEDPEQIFRNVNGYVPTVEDDREPPEALRRRHITENGGDPDYSSKGNRKKMIAPTASSWSPETDMTSKSKRKTP